MKSAKNLEETIKDKVQPLLEKSMEKSWGLTIPKLELDLSDRLKNQHSDLYIPFELDFEPAKHKFKKEFLQRELRRHLGNVSQLAKFLGIDRRSIHRAIKEFKIKVDRLKFQPPEEFQEEFIDKAIRSTLSEYKKIITPEKMEQMYQEVPSLSRNIAKVLPPPEMTWKEAEQEFERQFLSHALEENLGRVSDTAHKIGIRAETLHRKIKKLKLRVVRGQD
ncbi:MAG TPA: helix-turn-helix domain-containing protein [Candidatus Nanoarchaeia archaeon]|nr:helix-turn-helix domain-containing protein [Candidatus Nanoarchaeia archaeon]